MSRRLLLGTATAIAMALVLPTTAHAAKAKPKATAKKPAATAAPTTAAPAATAAPAPVTTAAPAAKKEQIYAIVLPSSKDDKAFSQAGYTGVLNAAKKTGAKVIFQENVPVSSATEALRNLAAQKPTVVMALGGQFADAIAAVAPDFADVQFVGVNGAKTGPNLSSWSLAEGEVAYLAGILVASENPGIKKIGRVAGITIAPLKLGTAGFIDGARSVDPAIEYVNTFTGNMDDVAKAKEATLAAANAGAKFVYTPRLALSTLVPLTPQPALPPSKSPPKSPTERSSRAASAPTWNSRQPSVWCCALGSPRPLPLPSLLRLKRSSSLAKSKLAWSLPQSSSTYLFEPALGQFVFQSLWDHRFAR
jgi:basic membrane lipoprotein Med (substrate-binding protein (PBP1-ABC) superfamily)